MNIICNKKYLDMIARLHSDFPHWDRLNGKSVLISGGTGMIGSLLVDAIMLRNQRLQAEDRCQVIAMGRNRRTAEERFYRRFYGYLRNPFHIHYSMIFAGRTIV